jgi:predicted nucleic acid-binding protein
VIIDASVAVKWFAFEEDSEAALALLDGRRLYAPMLVASEVANALWKKGRSEEIEPAVSFARDIARLPRLLELLDESSVVERAFEIAREIEHPVYDCVYLALAERRGENLITADYKFLKRLQRSACASLCMPLVDAR